MGDAPVLDTGLALIVQEALALDVYMRYVRFQILLTGRTQLSLGMIWIPLDRQIFSMDSVSRKEHWNDLRVERGSNCSSGVFWTCSLDFLRIT